MHDPLIPSSVCTSSPEEGVPSPAGLRWGVRLEQATEGLRIVYDDVTLAFEGPRPACIRAFLDRLDGLVSLEQACVASGLHLDHAATLIECLSEYDMLRPAAPVLVECDRLSGARFAELCRACIGPWKRRVFDHSLWRALASGTAPRSVFEGWLLENFHLIEGVTLRLGAAVAHCADDAMRRHFIKHFTEEYDHCEFFRRSLRVLGVSDESLLRSEPLTVTRAVIDWMRDASHHDPLCYAVCSAFLESTGADRQSATEFYARLSQAYEPRAVKPMAAHASLDEQYGHVGFLEKICAEIDGIDVARADRALRTLWGFVETLTLWSTVIERHYADGRPLFPGADGTGRPVRVYGGRWLAVATEKQHRRSPTGGYVQGGSAARATARPQLAPCLRTLLDGDSFIVDAGHLNVRYEGNGASLVAAVVAELDGRLTVAELVERHGIAIDVLAEVLAPLADESFLLDAALDEHETMSGPEFLAAFRQECRFWSHQVFSHPFWIRLRDGTVPLSVVLGWGVEFHHYVRHADRYMAAGVAYCADSWRTRQWLAKHFVEEVGHSEIFLQGLMGCGLSRVRVLDAMPLPATQALMHTLMESAYEGTVPYAACFGFTQPETIAPSPEAQRAFYDGLSAAYPEASSLFQAFLRHSLLDANLGHEQLVLERLFANATAVDRSHRAAAVRSVRRLAECFMVFFEQILDAYTDPVQPFPRRAPTVADMYP